MRCAQLGSTSNVTGTPSAGRPWAPCTRTITSVDCGRLWTSPTKMPVTSQIVGPEASKAKRYPAPGVGPTSCGAQAVRPTVRMRHVKTKAIRRPIRCSFRWGYRCRRCAKYNVQVRQHTARHVTSQELEEHEVTSPLPTA